MLRERLLDLFTEQSDELIDSLEEFGFEFYIFGKVLDNEKAKVRYVKRLKSVLDFSMIPNEPPEPEPEEEEEKEEGEDGEDQGDEDDEEEEDDED